MSTPRDALRALLLRSPSFTPRPVPCLIDGVVHVMYVKPPTIDERTEIINASKAEVSADKKITKQNIGRMQMQAVIACTYIDEAMSAQVFESADLPVLLAQSAGTYLDRLAEVALELMNVQAVDAGKN